MNYLDVIGTSLKDDFLLDLFETYDVDVNYIYDRTYEGMDDEYRAEIPEMGLEFLFNESQFLTTMFMRKSDHNGFNPFSGTDPRSAPFQTGVEAMEFAQAKSISAQHQEEKEGGVLGSVPEWVKLNFGSYSIHYQFNSSGIDMVTLQAENA